MAIRLLKIVIYLVLTLFINSLGFRLLKLKISLLKKTKDSAELYLRMNNYLVSYPCPLEYRLKAGKCQLQAILDYAQINHHSYQWADLWAGGGFWSMVILALDNKPVFHVDDSQYDLDPEFDSSLLINRLKLDTSPNSLPLNITGAF